VARGWCASFTAIKHRQGDYAGRSANAYAYSYAKAITNSNTKRDSNSNFNAYSKAVTDSNTYANPESHAYPSAFAYSEWNASRTNSAGR
jgi:hypothetical protein